MNSATATPPPLPDRPHAGPMILRWLLALAALALLLPVLLYLAENWRGKRAWQNCKRDLQARGEVHDWEAYMPLEVPDHQNVFKADHMTEWFVGRGTNDLVRRMNPQEMYLFSLRFHSNVVAQVRFVPPNEGPPRGWADLVLRFDSSVLTLADDSSSVLSDPRSVMPLVHFVDTPLERVIYALARQAELKYTLDPALDLDNPARPEPLVSRRLENVTAWQALFTLLNDHNLRWSEEPETGALRISRKNRGDPCLVYVDPIVRQRIETLLRNSIEVVTNAALTNTALGIQGFEFVARPLTRVKGPWRAVVWVEKPPRPEEVAQFFPTNVAAPNTRGVGIRVERAGQHFRLVSSPPPYQAAEYLAWSDQFESEFELMRNALKRPYGRMEGDFQEPTSVPFLNFAAARSVVHVLGQRAQCHLLLGEPDNTLQELTLLHDFRGLFGGKPPGKPMTLGAVMTQALFIQIYSRIVAEGLRRRAWQEPQLAAVQDQLGQTHLPEMLAAAFRTERASVIRLFDTALSSQDQKRVRSVVDQRMQDLGLFARVIPYGWFQQNYVRSALRLQDLIDALDSTNGVVKTHKVNQFASVMETYSTRFRPYTFAVPFGIAYYYADLVRSLARTQSWAEQTRVACALERYRLANGEYPESLHPLAPRFIESIPCDIVNGQRLIYRRTDAGGFLLYSAGWNATDDGGLVGTLATGSSESTQKDWVWPPGD